MGADLSDRPSAIVKRAEKALAEFVAQRVDLVTAGHLHRTYSAAFGAEAGTSAVVAEADEPGHKVTVIQAGTALSYRTRGEVNSFNRIEIDGDRLSVHPVSWYGTRWERDPDPLVVVDRPSASRP